MKFSCKAAHPVRGHGLLLSPDTRLQSCVLYGSDALVEVDGADDFIDKLRFYIQNDTERQKVARAGYELGHREFNERLVSQYMIETTLGLPFSHPYVWPLESYSSRAS